MHRCRVEHAGRSTQSATIWRLTANRIEGTLTPPPAGWQFHLILNWRTAMTYLGNVKEETKFQGGVVFDATGPAPLKPIS